MKKTATWIIWIAFAVTFVALAVIGVKIFDNNYDFSVEAYVVAAGFAVMFVCSLIRAFGNRCPHCGKTVLDNGKYCSYCGKKMNE